MCAKAIKIYKSSKESEDKSNFTFFENQIDDKCNAHSLHFHPSGYSENPINAIGIDSATNADGFAEHFRASR